MNKPGFRMGRLDHVHIRVPDRAEAARWYAEHLGFEPVERFDFWAAGFEGGPLQISADAFISFARSLPGDINNPDGQPLATGDLVDFHLCWAFNLVDPWGNQYELNCYDYHRIKAELVEADSIEPVRYWPRDLHDAHLSRTASDQR